jgi:putative membrane protein
LFGKTAGRLKNGIKMYTNGWSMVWVWIFWVGLMMLLFSNAGNWGYTYRAHRRFDGFASGSDALELLCQRYAKGEIKSDEFFRMRDEIKSAKQLSARSENSSVNGIPFSMPN